MHLHVISSTLLSDFLLVQFFIEGNFRLCCPEVFDSDEHTAATEQICYKTEHTGNCCCEYENYFLYDCSDLSSIYTVCDAP